MSKNYSTVHKINGLAYPLSLKQSKPDEFSVIYGKQVKSGLSYSQAASEYGHCIMHALACEGLIETK